MGFGVPLFFCGVSKFDLQVIIFGSLELVPKMEGLVGPMVDLDVEPFHSTERIPFVSW